MASRTDSDERDKGAAETDSATAGESVRENTTETDRPNKSAFLSPNQEYNMNHKRRGLALIFNHETFDWMTNWKPRDGTNVDRDNLITIFKALDFEVKSYNNSNRDEVLSKIAEAAAANHVDADCFVCVFLSHGENGHVFANDAKIEINEITDLFKGDKCCTLVGKPKIFIWQACRGKKYDDPVAPMNVEGNKTDEDVEVDAGGLYTLPAAADFIMCYSVAEGYYSFRDPINGSWYIQDLCEILRSYGSTLEIAELLTLVNRKVSSRSVPHSRNPLAIGKKQAPCFASMLTKKLFFRPK